MKQRDTHYQITVLSSTGFIPETVTDIRLFYVLDGACRVYTGGEETALAKWDTIIVNSMEAARLDFGAEDVVAMISIDYIMLCDALNTHAARFFLNSQQGTGQKYTQIRAQVQRLLMAHVGHEFAGTYKEMGCFYLLLQNLLSNFLIRNSENDDPEGGDLRVAKMIRYIRANYSTNLTLNEIADQLYLSPSTASRLFQKTTGKKFVTYISEPPVQECASLFAALPFEVKE